MSTKARISGIYSVLILTSLASAAFFGYRVGPYIGYINDDAAYITLASALLKGTYYSLSAPVEGSIIQFWPGYPLALAPWVALVHPHWAFLSFLSIVFVGLTCYLLVQFARIYLNGLAGLIFFIAFAFHPLTLQNASRVISEPLYILLTITFFLILHKQLFYPSLKKRILLVALLAWVILVRPEGVVLCISTYIALELANRRKEGLAIVLGAFPLWAFFPLWDKKYSHETPYYFSIVQSGIPLFAHQLADHWHRLLYFFFCVNLMGIQWPHRGFYILLSWFGILIGLSFCIFGFLNLLKQFPEKRGLSWGIAIYVAGLIAIHGIYFSIDERYFWPALPFILLFFIAGVQNAIPKAKPRVPGILMFLWLGFLLYPTVHLLQIALHVPPSLEKQFHRPDETFSWIKNNIPNKSLCMASEPMLYLYTGLRGIDHIEAKNREEFFFTLMQDNFQFIILFPVAINMPLTVYPGQSEAGMKLRNIRFISQWPHNIIPIYRNMNEQTIIYSVTPDKHFKRGYELYLDGVSDLGANHLNEAKKKFEAGLKLSPEMASLWTAYGILNYIERDYKSAGAKFTRSLTLQPDDIITNEYMARIQAILHHQKLAAIYYQTTIKLINDSGFYSELLPMLHQELGRLLIQS